MANMASESFPEYQGPYEFWLYNKGKGYAFPSIRHFRDGDPLTSLVELTEPFPVAALDDPTGRRPGDDQDFTFIVPQLWHGDGRFCTRFLPLGIPVIEGLGLVGLLDLVFQQLLNHFIGYGILSEGDEFRPRFKVNFPLPQSTIHQDLGHASQTHESWSPDPETRAAIDQHCKNLTIIGIIDDGIPFAHRNYRKACGTQTRIEYCWLQSAEGNPEPPVCRSRPEVPFGQEFFRGQIDDLIAAFPDEDELYRQAGIRDANPELGVALDRGATHGSHVADLAAGFPPSAGELPPDDIRIIAVQLPNTVGWDTSGFGKDMFMLAALHYIFERADRIAGAYYGIIKGETAESKAKEGKSLPSYPSKFLPLVVNMSVGFSGGPHDADANAGDDDLRAGSEIEHAIDEMVSYRRRLGAPTAVVMPAGNNFSDRMHAVLAAERLCRVGDKVFLDWRIQPNDRTPSYLEMWLPVGAKPEDFGVEISSPSGDFLKFDPPSDINSRGKGDRIWVRDIGSSSRLFGQFSVDEFRGRRWRILIALGPTEPEPFVDESTGEVVLPDALPAGKWRIALFRKTVGTLQGPILCWIQRDIDVQLKNTGARQSYLDMPGYSRFGEDGALDDKDDDDAIVRRFGSLNGMTTGSRTLVVAGYRGSAQSGFRSRIGTAPFFSAAGPETRASGFAKGVDLCALTSPGVAVPGLAAAGTKSGSLGFLLGTSAAAPQVTRALARIFADGGADDCPDDGDNYVGLLPGVTVPSVDGSSDQYAPPDLHNPPARLGKLFLPPIRHYRQG